MPTRRSLVFAVVALLGLLGCSSGTSSPGGHTDAAASDSVSEGDTGAATDATSSPATDAPVDVGSGKPCNLPSDCSGGEVCCGRIPITGGTVPNCTTGAIVTRCVDPSACTTALGSSCSGTQTVRLCAANADCTESTDNQCCTFGGSGDAGALSFCANSLVAAFGGGKCM